MEWACMRAVKDDRSTTRPSEHRKACIRRGAAPQWLDVSTAFA
jgi:hypothetical protein